MKKQFLLLLSLTLVINLFSQSNSWDGYSLAPNSKFRTLNIFINIIFDDSANYIVQGNSQWAQAYNEGVNNEAIPTILLDYFDTVYVSTDLNGIITQSFGESSFDSLQITGDFTVVNVLQSRITDTYGHLTHGNIVKAAIDLININGLVTIYGHNSIFDYDYKNEGKIFYTNAIIRNLKNTPLTTGGEGYIVNSKPIKIGGTYYNLDSGTTCGSLSYMLLRHEISHYLFGGNSFHTSGGNHRSSVERMPFFGLQGGHGLMGGGNTGLLSCNGYERWRMHWKYSNSDYYIGARDTTNTQTINADITKDEGNITFILRDFVTYGDAIRIKLPYKDSEESANQYIWLENHQVGSNNKLDYYKYSDNSSCRPAGIAGIYAYYQIGRDILSGSNNYVWYANERDNLKIIPAEGYYDFHYESVPNYNLECINWENHDYIFVRDAENSFCGNHDQEKIFFSNQFPNDNIIMLSHEKAMWRKIINEQNVDSLPFLGDNRDAFSTHRKINMGTNPSTCNAKTYYNYICRDGSSNFTNGISKNNQSTYLTGLSIEMTPSQNGTITVKIRWDDYEVTENCRWTGKIVNKETVHLTEGKIIEFAQNKTVAEPYRNTDNGFFSPSTILICEENSIFNQCTNSHVIFKENSTMMLQTGAVYVIEEDADLTIKSGCTLDVEDCATLEINGQLIIEEGANVNISSNASIKMKSLDK